LHTLCTVSSRTHNTVSCSWYAHLKSRFENREFFYGS
jgi:hypothetical protein